MRTKQAITAEDVKEAGKLFGADLVGIGSIDRWANAPAGRNPKTILPTAKSVIALAFRLHRGVLESVDRGTYYSAYTLTEFDDLNRVVSPMVLRKMASFLEDRGYETLPVMYYSHNLSGTKGEFYPEPGEEGDRKPDIFIDFRIGGVLCGLGEIGMSRLLLTPEFGPAQRVYFLITSAELEADELRTGICDKCMRCVRSCPAKALDPNKPDDVDVPGVINIKRCSINDTRCRLAHVSGAFSPFAPDEIKDYVNNIINGTDTETADGKPYPTAAEIKENVTDKIDYAVVAEQMFASPSALCGFCLRSCVKHLDQRGKLEKY